MRPREPRLYLQDIEVAISRILEFTSGGRAELFESELVHDAVIRRFEIIGEAVRNLPEEMLAAEPEMSLRRAVRVRDRPAHGYFTVDLGIDWDTIENDRRNCGRQFDELCTSWTRTTLENAPHKPASSNFPRLATTAPWT